MSKPESGAQNAGHIKGHNWRLVEEQDVFYTATEALKRFGQAGVAGMRTIHKRCADCDFVEENLVSLDRQGLPMEDF